MKNAPDAATLVRADASVEKVRVDRFQIQVTQGQPKDVGTELEVSEAREAPAFVGKVGCDLNLTDPLVSRRHLQLSVADGCLRVRDLGSTNHTRVNGARVVEAMLEGGELLRIGDTHLTVSRLEQLSVPLTPATSFGRILGASVAMRRLYPFLERLAHLDTPVLIEGETGTGKELLAESLHENGPRAQRPFMVIDCEALLGSDVDATLFGKGDSQGMLDECAGGTMVFVELFALPPNTQARLLRLADRREAPRSPDGAHAALDVRLIATTSRDVDKLVQDGAVREDIFFRVATSRVELPPLRERTGDPAVLLQHFWSQFTRDGSDVPADLFDACTGRSWPGNVRELRNLVLQRALSGATPPAAPQPDHPSVDLFQQVLDRDLSFAEARRVILDEFESRFIRHVLKIHNGNIARAAAASGIARRHFYTIKNRQRAQ